MAVTTSTLLVGDSGSGKTALLGTYAKWVWQKYKKVTLLYSIDSGGYGTTIEALVQAGIIRIWKIRTRGESFETCQLASRGHWPDKIDPESGECEPGAALIAPLSKKYTLHCPCGSAVTSSKNKKIFAGVAICPACKQKVNLQNGRISEELIRSPLYTDVGAAMYDGITSMQAWIMEDMAQKTADGELKGETAMGKLSSGDMHFGSSTRNHYGFAQVRAETWISDANAIPGLVVGPIFTARELRATDGDSKLPIYGPKLAGKAKTDEVPAWFANCLGCKVFIDDKGRKEWRLYLTEYREDDGIPHLCKTRAQPGTMPEYLSDGWIESGENLPKNSEGKVVAPFTNFNLGHFMSLMDAAREQILKDTAKEFEGSPGLNYAEVADAPEAAAKAAPKITLVKMPPTKKVVTKVVDQTKVVVKPVVKPIAKNIVQAAKKAVTKVTPKVAAPKVTKAAVRKPVKPVARPVPAAKPTVKK